MESIIQHIVAKYKKILEEGLEASITGKEISKLSKSVHEFTDKIGTEIFEQLVEAVDKIIFEDQKRKVEYEAIRISGRTLLVENGKSKFERRYYQDKQSGEYIYLADKILGIEKGERIDKNVTAKAIELAGSVSYAKAGKNAVASEEVSRTSVMNRIRKNELKVEPKELEDKREVEYLYIQADEDHYKERNKGSSISKIITIFEGSKIVSKNIVPGSQVRKELTEKFTITGVYDQSEDMWLEAANYIESKYNLEKIKKVYISGDGASWIKEGLNWIIKSQFVLDKIHLEKYILKLNFNEEKQRHLRNAIEQFDPISVENILTSVEGGLRWEIQVKVAKGQDIKIETRRLKKATEAKTYIINQWEGIEIYETDKDTIIGCCQEAQVSHVLSERLSTRPMAWSKDGADKMSKVRAFLENDGDVYGKIIDISTKEKRDKRIAQLENRVRRNMRRTMFGTVGTKIPELQASRDELYCEIKELLNIKVS